MADGESRVGGPLCGYLEADHLLSKCGGGGAVRGGGREVQDLRQDEAAGVLVCLRAGGVLGGKATVTIRFEAPEGVPSTTIRLRSETEGGLMPRDKANVGEFMKPYNRRVC